MNTILSLGTDRLLILMETLQSSRLWLVLTFSISDHSKSLLQRYMTWPGNLKNLEHLKKRESLSHLKSTCSCANPTFSSIGLLVRFSISCTCSSEQASVETIPNVPHTRTKEERRGERRAASGHIGMSAQSSWFRYFIFKCVSGSRTSGSFDPMSSHPFSPESDQEEPPKKDELEN